MARFAAREYFEEFTRACDRAILAVGEEVVDLRLGEVLVRLRFVGSALASSVLPALAHVRSPVSSERPVLEVELWDGESTGVLPPPLPLRGDDAPAHSEIRDYDEDGIRGLFHSGVRPQDGSFASLTLIDEPARVARYFVISAEWIPWYERAMPLRAVFQCGLIGPERLLAHAGAVGVAGRGVLLTGPKGSGKSTSAVAALLAGCDFLGDDYVLVEPARTPPVAHSIYATAKLAAPAAALLSNLPPGLLGPLPGADEKHVIDVAQLAGPGRLRNSIPIAAIVLPRVRPGAPTTARPVSAGDALRALAPTTVFQSPRRDGLALRPLAELARRVPAYTLELGGDPADVGPALSRLLDRAGG